MVERNGMEKKSCGWIAGIGCLVLGGLGGVGLIVVLVYLGTGPDGGTRLAPQMEEYATIYLENHNILDPGEKLVAYYDATIALDGSEAVILTKQRLIYHLNGENNIVYLNQINNIKERDDGLAGTAFEIYTTDGNYTEVLIAPLNGADTFKNALENTLAHINEVD